MTRHRPSDSESKPPADTTPSKEKSKSKPTPTPTKDKSKAAPAPAAVKEKSKPKLSPAKTKNVEPKPAPIVQEKPKKTKDKPMEEQRQPRKPKDKPKEKQMTKMKEVGQYQSKKILIIDDERPMTSKVAKTNGTTTTKVVETVTYYGVTKPVEEIPVHKDYVAALAKVHEEVVSY